MSTSPGQAQTYAYDEAGNLESVADPLSDQTQYTYDAVNDRLTVQDANTHTTSYTYDTMNRLATVTAPGTPTATTTYTYDAQGSLHTRTDARTNVTTWDHDLDGQVTDITTPVGTWTYTYDDGGNVETLTKPSGTNTPTGGDGQISYAYDRMNRLTGVDYSDSTPDVTYDYDHAGRRTSMSDGIGTEDYDYDDADRLTDVTRGTDTFHYDYDQLNVTGRTYPDGTSITAAYNDDEELASLTIGSNTTNLTYDPAGRLSTTAYPSGNGYTETRTYDRAGRLGEVSNDAGSTVLSRFTRTLDAVGNPTLIATRRGATTTNVAYTYDDRDRLTKACYGATTCTGASDYLAYGYDKSSNLTSQDRVGSVPNPASWTLSYNSADQLTSRTDGTTTINYTYDDNGNLATAGSRSYTYDLADQQTQTSLGGTTSDYTYDGDGKRLTSTTSGGADIRYWWDIQNPMPMLAQEDDLSASTLIRRYVNGPQGALSMTTGGGTYYLHRDPLGSITDLTNSTGIAQWNWDYEPYGSTLSQLKLDPSAPDVTLGYTGQYQDPETSTYQMRARQYDPAVGRFESLDPATPTPTTPYTGSYLYAGGQPTLLIDPLGLWPNPLDDLQEAAGDLKDAASDIGSTAVNTVTNIATTTASAASSAGGYVLDKTQAGAEWAYNHPLEVWSAASIGIAFLPGGAIAVAGIDLAIAGYQLEHGNTLDAALWALPAGAGGVGILANVVRECAAVRAIGGNAALFRRARQVLGDERGEFNPGAILGARGTRTTSTTLARGRGYRIDIENPAPGVRPGQLHLQDAAGRKYLYDFEAGAFPGLPRSLAKQLAVDPKVERAIAKGRRYLGIGE